MANVVWAGKMRLLLSHLRSIMAQPTALIRLQVRRGFALLQGQSNTSAPTVTRVYNELRIKGLQLAEGIRCWRRNP